MITMAKLNKKEYEYMDARTTLGSGWVRREGMNNVTQLTQ